jgi:prophage antirepressor-like protein
MKTEKGMQVNGLQRFFDENLNVCVRAQVINNEPWFVAKDVCQALGLQWTGHILDNIQPSWKGVVNFTTPSSGDRGGGLQTLRVVNMKAVFKLSFRSNKPQADNLANWLADEVIPSLISTGVYAMKGSLNRNGVEGILYNGMKLYPYKEMLLSYGYSGRSGSVQRRKKVYPYYFVKVYGRVYIKEEMAVYLEEEKKHIDRRLEMMKKQQELPFDIEA